MDAALFKLFKNRSSAWKEAGREGGRGGEGLRERRRRRRRGGRVL